MGQVQSDLSSPNDTALYMNVSYNMYLHLLSSNITAWRLSRSYHPVIVSSLLFVVKCI